MVYSAHMLAKKHSKLILMGIVAGCCLIELQEKRGFNVAISSQVNVNEFRKYSENVPWIL